MLSRILPPLALVALVTPGAHAQSHAAVDSLIQHFVEAGPSSSWRPWMLFEGCPRLQSWQEYGFQRLAAMELSRDRENELARSWQAMLRDCSDPRLEQWYLDRFAAAALRGNVEEMSGVWMALQIVDSPRIRTFFRDLLHDPQQTVMARNAAGEMYFERLNTQERLREYLSLFSANRLPPSIAWRVTESLMIDGHGAALIDGVAQVLAVDVRLANQYAFDQLLVSSSGRVGQRHREHLADALDAGLAQCRDMSAADVERLRAAAAHLRRSQQ
jgi:hypothetical protein